MGIDKIVGGPTVDETDKKNTLAKRTGCTKSFYARELIEGNLEDLEDRYLAEAAWKNTACR